MKTKNITFTKYWKRLNIKIYTKLLNKISLIFVKFYVGRKQKKIRK